MRLKKFCEMSPEKNYLKSALVPRLVLIITAKLQNLIFVFLIAAKLSHLIARYILALSGERCAQQRTGLEILGQEFPKW
jgi:hypothetical protein